MSRRGSSRPEYGRIIRGAMLTPWFAVSVGIVVATSLTLAAPHPALTFPPSTSGHCVKVACASQTPPPTGRSPAIKHDLPLPKPTPLKESPQPDANVHPAVKVEYQMLPRFGSHFSAVIVIIGKKPLGNWSLKFTLPKATIQSIMWAKWQAAGRHGVIVTGAPSPWPRSGANEARIVVFGKGKPRWPRDCTFDGVACVFRALTDSPQRHGSWPAAGPWPAH